MIRTQSDWDAYVAGSSSPGLNEALPFDPATQMLLVIGNAEYPCSYTSSIQQVCYTIDQVEVHTQTQSLCCGNPPAFPGLTATSFGIIVPKSVLPVVWSNTYVPLPPDAYLYCI